MKWIWLLMAWCIASSVSLAEQQDTLQMKRDMERVYAQWRTAFVSKDLRAWMDTTSAHRQISIRNLIVSQKQPFPKALFDVPILPPEIGTLRFVDLQVKGPTAHLYYFGKVDIGVADRQQIPETLLILSFDRESSAWKFNQTRMINLQHHAHAQATLQSGGRPDLLQDPELAPTGSIPAVAKPCPTPERVAMLQIASFGYEVEVAVNGFAIATVVDNEEDHLIIGGLRAGKNALQVQVKKVPFPQDAPADAERVLHFSAIVMQENELRPQAQVFNWTSSGPVDEGPLALNIFVTPLTLRAR